MFAKTMTSVAAVLLLCAQGAWAQGTASPPAKAPSTKTIPDDESAVAGAATTVPVPAGTWRAKTERLPLTAPSRQSYSPAFHSAIRNAISSFADLMHAPNSLSRRMLSSPVLRAR